jgi:ribosomal protein S18 acetylase RimI-like enzyme
MSDQALTAVGTDDQAKAYATLLSAFTDDPVERWLYPETPDYLTHFPEFLKAFGGKAFDEETVWGLEDCAAVALWLPPGAEPDGDLIANVLTETVSPTKHDDLFAVMELMGAAHPSYSHWYLPWFGVDAARQGSGLGASLMALCLPLVDESGLPTYLETPNPRTVPFYRRHGFEVVGEAQSGACPPMVFMLRPAQR